MVYCSLLSAIKENYIKEKGEHDYLYDIKVESKQKTTHIHQTASPKRLCWFCFLAHSLAHRHIICMSCTVFIIMLWEGWMHGWMDRLEYMEKKNWVVVMLWNTVGATESASVRGGYVGSGRTGGCFFDIACHEPIAIPSKRLLIEFFFFSCITMTLFFLCWYSLAHRWHFVFSILIKKFFCL